MSHPREVTDNEFESVVLKSDKPVLVDFWAPWCGPCRALAPTIEEIKDEYAGTVEVVKVNTDDNPMVPTRLGIQGIPTMVLFQGGKEVQRLVGNHPKGNIVRMLSAVQVA